MKIHTDYLNIWTDNNKIDSNKKAKYAKRKQRNKTLDHKNLLSQFL